MCVLYCIHHEEWRSCRTPSSLEWSIIAASHPRSRIQAPNPTLQMHIHCLRSSTSSQNTECSGLGGTKQNPYVPETCEAVSANMSGPSKLLHRYEMPLLLSACCWKSTGSVGHELAGADSQAFERSRHAHTKSARIFNKACRRGRLTE